MENNTGTFLLGVIAAVVLFLLWKKERAPGGFLAPGTQPSGGTGAAPACGAGGCSGCGTGGGCGGGYTAPALDFSASPDFQASMASMGLDGQISPGTPPLGGNELSFYSSGGMTPDTTFTFQKTSATPAGSPTTSAATTPIRATTPVASYADTGFVSKYSVSGTYRRALLA